MKAVMNDNDFLIHHLQATLHDNGEWRKYEVWTIRICVDDYDKDDAYVEFGKMDEEAILNHLDEFELFNTKAEAEKYYKTHKGKNFPISCGWIFEILCLVKVKKSSYDNYLTEDDFTILKWK